MRQDLRAGAAALLAGLLAGALPAHADFWSDAGAKFKGATLHGVTESTPPRTTSRTYWRRSSEGDRDQGRVRDDVLGPDVRQGDQGHGGQAPASTTSSTSSRTSSTATCRGTSWSTSPSRSRTTRSSADPTSTRPSSPRSSNYFKNRRTAISSACRWRPSSRSTSTARTCSRTPRSRRPSRRSTGKDLAPAKTHRGIPRQSPSSSPSGARRTASTCGAPPCRRHPATRPRGTSSSKSIAPTFGVYNWGINTRQLARQRRAMAAR